MSFKRYLKDTINDWIDNISYPTNPTGLYEPIRYTLESGGKRLRPTLLLAAAKAYGCDAEKVRSQCIGIEMFHNFTLLHDDVMDNSELRRGRPTVHQKWNTNTAILSGDTMLTMATQYISDCQDDYLKKILGIFNKTAIEVYEGQQMDMDFENRQDVTVEEYLEMIRLKTSVLLGCAAEIGAILGGADNEEATSFYNYGLKMGLGFQLRDDYLDTFGDPLVFGKHIGGDILNDKKTWLMITAVKEDKSGVMNKALSGQYEDGEKIAMVTGVYQELGLQTRILELIKKYSEEAIKSLEHINVSDEARRYFYDLACALTERMS